MTRPSEIRPIQLSLSLEEETPRKRNLPGFRRIVVLTALCLGMFLAGYSAIAGTSNLRPASGVTSSTTAN